jgi:hypothetical protein
MGTPTVSTTTTATLPAPAPTDGTGQDGDDGDPTADLTGALPPVQLLVRVELAALLDQAATPAQLLTRLVGGRLRLTAAATRQLVAARGASLRTLVIDHGTVIGVGRRTRIPPGWLVDATRAVHDTCTGPLCDRPARSADLDHATPWHPTRPDTPAGRTDLDNLGPLCATTNRTKEAGGWHATQTPDGRRTWTHRRTGLTVTTIPTTWRPPGHPPPARPDRRDRRRAPTPGTDPPGETRPAGLPDPIPVRRLLGLQPHPPLPPADPDCPF